MVAFNFKFRFTEKAFTFHPFHCFRPKALNSKHLSCQQWFQRFKTLNQIQLRCKTVANPKSLWENRQLFAIARRLENTSIVGLRAQTSRDTSDEQFDSNILFSNSMNFNSCFTAFSLSQTDQISVYFFISSLICFPLFRNQMQMKLTCWRCEKRRRKKERKAVKSYSWEMLEGIVDISKAESFWDQKRETFLACQIDKDDIAKFEPLSCFIT